MSATTASRALKRDSRIAEGTIQRVQSAAQRLGYRPDPVLGLFAANRRWLGDRLAGLGIAIVGAGIQKGVPRVVPGIRARAEELGYRAEVVDLEEFLVGEAQRMDSILYHRGVRGIALLRHARHESFPDWTWDRFSMVQACTSEVDGPGPLVSYNAFLQTRQAFEALVGAGCRRIGCGLLDLSMTRNDEAIAAAVLWEQRQRGLPEIPVRLGRPGASEELATARWAIEQKLDGLLGMHDGVYWGMLEAGLAVPRDMAFVSLHREPVGDLIAGYLNLDTLIGRATADLLDLQIKHNVFGLPKDRQVLLLAPQWLPGVSCPGPGPSELGNPPF